MTLTNYKSRDYFALTSVNPVIRFLTLSDLIIVSCLGLITPIFAVFITNAIPGGNLAVVGIAEACYLLAKSIFQIPFAMIVDKIKGEKDDFMAALIGSLMASFIPLLYIIIDSPLQLYGVQFLYGLSYALAQPAWNAIWMRHIDKGHEGLESGIYFTLVGLGGALTASLGGFISNEYGFNPLFVVVSIASFIGSMFLLLIYKHIHPGKILVNSKF